MIWSNYNGGRILRGHLIATLLQAADSEHAMLDAHYHHINDAGAIMAGTCSTRIEVLPGGRYRLHENWQWTSGSDAKGTSVLEEIGAEALTLSA